MYLIKTENLYADMLDHNDDYDLSNFPADHPCFRGTNKAIIGKFKDEAAGMPILEFVGLRAKMYSYQMVAPNGSLQDKFRAKGLAAAVRRGFTHGQYKRQLDEPAENYYHNRRLGANRHNIVAIDVGKYHSVSRLSLQSRKSIRTYIRRQNLFNKSVT